MAANDSSNQLSRRDMPNDGHDMANEAGKTVFINQLTATAEGM